MNVQGCLAFTRTFRVEILSINKKITRWDDSLPSGRCRPSDKGGGGYFNSSISGVTFTPEKEFFKLLLELK